MAACVCIIYAGTYAYAGQRLTLGLYQLLFHLSFRDSLSRGLELADLISVAGPVSSSSVLCLQAWSSAPRFYEGVGDLNSESRACTASTLVPMLSPSPLQPRR